MIRTILSLICATFFLVTPALAEPGGTLPKMPAGFDIRNNAVQGGKIGEPLTLQITAYNAGKELFSNDLFTVYERINFLAMRSNQYGDAICTVTKPGTEYERYHSRVVVVFNVERHERISEDMLWNELRDVLSNVIHPKICPKANYITAHVYAKNWDLTAAGQIYRPENVRMPVVTLPAKEPLTDFEIKNNLDKRNQIAYDVIQEVVSEGILVAHFQYEINGYHGCDKVYSMDGCTRETFAPLYWGAPDIMMVYSLNNELLRNRSYGTSPSALEGYKTKLDRVRTEYAQYTSFDGYMKGFAARQAKNKKARAHNAARQKAIDDFNEMLRAGWKIIEEEGLGAIVSPPSASGPCDIRYYAGSCIEDVIMIPGYP